MGCRDKAMVKSINLIPPFHPLKVLYCGECLIFLTEGVTVRHAFLVIITTVVTFKIEYHAVGDTWCQPLLSFGNCVCM